MVSIAHAKSARIRLAGCLTSMMVLAAPLPGAQAAEIKVLAFLSSRPILEQLGPVFEKASGHKLNIAYGSVEPQRDLIIKGEVADVAITSGWLADDLRKAELLTRITLVANITVSLFVRAGAPKPDIGTVEALKASLLKAESVAFTNPARGALAGRSFANALKRMDIYDQVLKRAKIIPGLGHDVVAAVARGEATIGAGPTNDVTPLPKGVDVLGGLPKELESDTPIVAVILKTAPAPDAAAEFVNFLRSPAGAAAVTAHGLEP
jgi:molybdate transport system substrate-binding protein